MSILARRLLLGATAAGAVTATAAIQALSSEVAAGSTGPDALLLAACAEFDRIEREYLALFFGPNAIADEDERETAIAPNREAQMTSWNVICATQAKTLEGLRAKAQSAALEDFELIRGLRECMNSRYIDERLQASLMLDVFAVLEVKETPVPARGGVA